MGIRQSDPRWEKKVYDAGSEGGINKKGQSYNIRTLKKVELTLDEVRRSVAREMNKKGGLPEGVDAIKVRNEIGKILDKQLSGENVSTLLNRQEYKFYSYSKEELYLFMCNMGDRLEYLFIEGKIATFRYKTDSGETSSGQFNLSFIDLPKIDYSYTIKFESIEIYPKSVSTFHYQDDLLILKYINGFHKEYVIYDQNEKDRINKGLLEGGAKCTDKLNHEEREKIWIEAGIRTYLKDKPKNNEI